MKTNKINIANTIQAYVSIVVALYSLNLLSSCSKDDPNKEDVPELITKVIVNFVPSNGGATIVATANDPDGTGIQNLVIDGPINLSINTTYTLSIQLINGLAAPTDGAYNVTAEVEKEADEHIFFFGWTNDLFSSPVGNGNIDNRNDVVNYADKDANGLSLGLKTNWSTAGTKGKGTFHVILKHQPNLKSVASTSTMGETDLDILFDLSIQ